MSSLRLVTSLLLVSTAVVWNTASAAERCDKAGLRNILESPEPALEPEKSKCYERLAFEFGVPRGKTSCPKGSVPVDGTPGKCKKFGQGINFKACDPINVGDVCDAGGWAYQVDSVRVKNGALVKTNDGVFRTSMKRNSKVDVCLFGRIDTGRLRTQPKSLQFTAHGEIEGKGLLASGLEIIGDLTGTGSELAFCKETGGELKANVCKNEGSTCQGLASDDGIKNFCACTSLNVPPIPSLGELDKLRVKVTLKMLHAPKENDLNQCVREFGIEKLFNQESKQTLSCINIPTFIPPAK